MQGAIREKQKLTFGRKRISPYIIRQFAHIIHTSVEELKLNNEDVNVIFSIDAEDNSSFESESIAIFDEGGMLDTKAIKKINMSMISFRNSFRIDLQLAHVLGSEKEKAENYVWVSGNNSIWVNGIMQKYKGAIERLEPHPKHTGKATFLIICAIIVLTVYVYRITFQAIGDKKDLPALLALIVGFGPAIGGIALLITTTNYLNVMWPDVELQTGPSHQQMALQKRKKAIWLVSTIIIPLILAIVYDMIKNN